MIEVKSLDGYISISNDMSFKFQRRMIESKENLIIYIYIVELNQQDTNH